MTPKKEKEKRPSCYRLLLMLQLRSHNESYVNSASLVRIIYFWRTFPTSQHWTPLLSIFIPSCNNKGLLQKQTLLTPTHHLWWIHFIIQRHAKAVTYNSVSPPCSYRPCTCVPTQTAFGNYSIIQTPRPRETVARQLYIFLLHLPQPKVLKLLTNHMPKTLYLKMAPPSPWEVATATWQISDKHCSSGTCRDIYTSRVLARVRSSLEYVEASSVSWDTGYPHPLSM